MASRHDTKLVFSGVDKTKHAFGSMGKSFGRLKSIATGTGAKLISLAGVGGFGLLIKSSLQWSDELGKMSDRLNIATQDIAAFQFQAALTGTSAVQVNTALEKMTKNIGDAANGLGTARPYLQNLNIDIAELSKLKGDEQYLKIADAISKLPNQVEKASAASAIFGRTGLKMINMLEEGRGGFEKARKEASDLGIALNRIDAAKVEAANDAWERAQMVVKGVSNRITVSLAPLMTALSNRFTQAAKDSKGWGSDTLDAFDQVARAVGFVADAIRGLEVVFKTINMVALSFVSGTITAFDELYKGVSSVVDMIPGLEATPAPHLSEYAENSRKAVADLQQEIMDLVMTPMPSENVKRTFDEIKAEASAAAEEIAAKKLAAAAPADTGEADPALAKRFMQLEQSLKSEDDLLEEKHIARLQTLADYADETNMQESTMLAISEEINRQHLAKVQKMHEKAASFGAKFQKMSLDAQVKTVTGSLSEMTAGIASENRAAFEVNKAAGIANAIVSTYQGAAEALKMGPIIGPIMAAATVAFGMMQVGKIASTSYGSKSASGGSGGPSVPSGGAVPSLATSPGLPVTQTNAAAQPAAPTQHVTVSVEAGIYDANAVRQLIASINEQVGDGVQLGTA